MGTFEKASYNPTPLLQDRLEQMHIAQLEHDEEVLGFTLDNKKCLKAFVGNAESCVSWDDEAAIKSILTGEFGIDDIYTNDWKYPVGAFHGADGGSC